MAGDHLRLVVDNSEEQQLQALYEEAGRALGVAKDALRTLAERAERMELPPDALVQEKQADLQSSLETAAATAELARLKLIGLDKAPENT